MDVILESMIIGRIISKYVRIPINSDDLDIISRSSC
jgi:hypothetical protein